ncbi:M56 family metallopeptidase, partial [Enhygromyxa salina]|uniref:M56 family metallopeptidase n=1 Tax=Enhygromyxa salina TaxID=215803 RepID=UPI0011BA4F12
MNITLVLSWMLTYLIHSTILVLAVWLICRGIRPLAQRIGPSGENLGWKLALVGGLVTATVQVAAGVTPALGALQLETGPKLVERAAPAPARSPQPAAQLVPVGQHGEFVAMGARPLPSVSAAPVAAVEPVVEQTPAPVWPVLLLVAWLLGVVIALVRLASSVRGLRRRLADRSEVLEDPVLEAFLTLCRDAEVNRKIRLTQSTRIAAPIALWRNEIVIPRRAVEELSPAAMRSVLAHELAHLERRDPHWLALAAVLEALCFFQPLNRLARRGMQESAELLCDDWAIAHTGDGVGFAKSLAEVASWTHANRSSLLLAGMLSGERPLVSRVKRALDGDPQRFDPDDGARPTRLLVGLGTLSALIMFAPGAVDASPPKQAAADKDKHETREDRRIRKARDQAERDAAKAEARARKAREQAERAEQEAARLEQEAARARSQLGGDAAHGGQHLIIRDGKDYLIIDENGLRLHSDEADVEIIDGSNPKMRVRVHEDDLNLDFDVDLETLSGMAEMFAGELFGPDGISPGELESLENDWETWGHQLERELEGQFEDAARQLLEHQRRHQQDRPGMAPTPPAPPRVPAGPGAAPTPPTPPSSPHAPAAPVKPPLPRGWAP